MIGDCLWKIKSVRNKRGTVSATFVLLYAIFRISMEQFRQPDAHIGFLTSWGLTMGQLLSGIMFFCGFTIFMFAIRKK